MSDYMQSQSMLSQSGHVYLFAILGFHSVDCVTLVREQDRNEPQIIHGDVCEQDLYKQSSRLCQT